MVRSLGWVNWVVIGVYLSLIFLIGVLAKWKQKATSDVYLKGDTKTPTIVLAVSIWATTLSAITFMGFTATVFESNWKYWIGMISTLIIAPFIIRYIIPFYRKLKVTTAYEYLEYRFHSSLRVFSSLIFILFHIGRIAIVIYIPTIAIWVVTGYNPYLIALVVSVLTIVYTMFGGLKGVMWTDFVQGMVFLLGIILTIVFAIYYSVGSFGSMMANANNSGHILPKSSWISTIALVGIPAIFIGQMFNNIYQYVASQDVAQRYSGAKSTKRLGNALWINGILAVVGTALLAIIGTLMWAFYKGDNAALNLNHFGLTKADIPSGNASYPTFALDILPVGISGLVIASIVAAAQSTISSSLSAITSCVSVDIFPLFKNTYSKIKNKLVFLWSITAIAGSIGLLLALGLIFTNQDNIFNYWLGIMGLFGGPVSTVFLLGIFTKKCNTIGALTSLSFSFLIILTCWIYTQIVPSSEGIDFIWYPIFGIPPGLVVGYLVSIFTQKYNKKIDITPLTVFGIKDKYNNKSSQQK